MNLQVLLDSAENIGLTGALIVAVVVLFRAMVKTQDKTTIALTDISNRLNGIDKQAEKNREAHYRHSEEAAIRTERLSDQHEGISRILTKVEARLDRNG